VIQLSRGFAARVIALVRTGLIVGVVVAALVYPLAAVAGLGIKAGAEQLDGQAESLPDALPAQTTRLYAADGTTMLAQFYDEHRIYAPISTISAFVKQAIVAAEDARFYDHHGVDLKGIARAFVANHRSGQVAQGASTLTMQYVRNVLRDSASTPEQVEAATAQTGARKLREIRLAVAVEQRMSKTDILERYLNVAYFGHRAYGITAASEVYFSKEPGFGKSVNTYFVQLEQKADAENAVRMAERLGLRWRTGIDKLQASPAKASGWGAFTLGVADTTPLEMANAYATLAADGSYCEPLPVTSITGPDGLPATYRTVVDGKPAGNPVEVAAVSAGRPRPGTRPLPCEGWLRGRLQGWRRGATRGARVGRSGRYRVRAGRYPGTSR
jgi:membrane peptidoglycan carboxypeptidase